MIKLTREDLAMMLDEMNNCGADYLDVDVDILGYDYYLRWVDFDACKKRWKIYKNTIDIRIII